MNDIQTLATTDHDYPFGTLADDQRLAWTRLTSSGYSRLQIQTAIVRELEKMDVDAFNAFLRALDAYWAGDLSHEAVEQANDKTYRIRQRLTACTRELNRQMAKTN